MSKFRRENKFNYKGNKYVAVDARLDECVDCDFFNSFGDDHCICHVPSCVPTGRKDGRCVIYKKVS